MSDAATKTCFTCGMVGALEMFLKKQNMCKTCATAYRKAWYQAHQEESIAKSTAYAKRHQNATREYQKKWRAENVQKKQDLDRGWYVANRDEALARLRRWKEENPGVDTAWRRNSRETLAPHYIKSLIARRTGMSESLIPPELIEVKRKHLQILRAIKETKNER